MPNPTRYLWKIDILSCLWFSTWSLFISIQTFPDKICDFFLQSLGVWERVSFSFHIAVNSPESPHVTGLSRYSTVAGEVTLWQVKPLLLAEVYFVVWCTPWSGKQLVSLQELTYFCPACVWSILQICLWGSGPISVSSLSLSSFSSSLDESGASNFPAFIVELCFSLQSLPLLLFPVWRALFNSHMCQDSSIFTVAPVMVSSNCQLDSVETLRTSLQGWLSRSGWSVGMSVSGGGGGVVLLLFIVGSLKCTLLPQLGLYNSRVSNLSNKHVLLHSLCFWLCLWCN